jgi:hypothetical protein
MIGSLRCVADICSAAALFSSTTALTESVALTLVG